MSFDGNAENMGSPINPHKLADEFREFLNERYGDRFTKNNGGFILMLIEEKKNNNPDIDNYTNYPVIIISDYTPVVCPHCYEIIKMVLDAAKNNLEDVSVRNN